MEVARVNTVSWTLDQLEATAKDLRPVNPELAQRIQANASVVVIEFDALYGFVRTSISYNAWIGTSLPLDSHEVSIAMPLDDEYAIDEAYAALDTKSTDEEVITEDPEMIAAVATFMNADAARYESFESSYRPLSHGGWFVDEDGEVM